MFRNTIFTNKLLLCLALIILAQSHDNDFFEKSSDSHFQDLEASEQVEDQKERIMVEMIQLNFEEFKEISDEDSYVYGMRLMDDYLLYTGYNVDKTKFVKFNGSGFKQEFNFEAETNGYDTEMNMTRNWLFEGNSRGKINFYQKQGDTYQLKQVIEEPGSIALANFMDLQQDYLLVNFENKNSLFKWNGTKFNKERQFKESYQSYGLEMCSDGTIITSEYDFGTESIRSVFKVYNLENTESIQEIELDQNTMYTLISTDDCQTVVLSPYYETTGNIYVLYRKNEGEFYIDSTYKSSRVDDKYRKTCIHPDGDFFMNTRDGGSDIWVRNSEGDDYVFYSSIANSSFSCAISRQMIVLADEEGKVSYAPYFWQVQNLDPPEYGLKHSITTEMSSEILPLSPFSATVIGLKINEGDLIATEEYIGTRIFEKKSGNNFYSLKQDLQDHESISSVDAQGSLLVQGSYDQIAYIYKKSETGYDLAQTITTESQILAVDVDQNHLIVLGHMNGDITYYQSNQNMYSLGGSFSTGGSKVHGVKSCPSQNDIILILKEQGGRFYLSQMEQNGVEKQSILLDEKVGVKFAVSEDCRKVVIASNRKKTVEVFLLEYEQYYLFETIQEQQPLSGIALNPDADIFVVNRHLSHSSVIYKFDKCTQKYEQLSTLQANYDQYSVEMTNNELIIGGLHGEVQIHKFLYSTRDTCVGFGLKNPFPAAEMAILSNEMTNVTRSISQMDISDNLVVANSKYSGLLFFQIPEEGPIEVSHFNESIFISSVSIISSSINTFAAGTYEKKIFIYEDSSSGYKLKQTIQTHSQVTSLDLYNNTRLLFGTINGDLVELKSSDDSPFQMARFNITNPGSQVFSVKRCTDYTIALLQNAGVFTLQLWDHAIGFPTQLTQELQEEFIELYMAVSDDCQIIAISGVTMQKVKVFRQSSDGFSLFQTIDVGSPLSKVSVEENGDMLVVPSYTEPQSYFYHYSQCNDEYRLVDKLFSGTEDASTAMTDRFILQGNEDGNIQINKFSWTYEAQCLVSSDNPNRSKDVDGDDIFTNSLLSTNHKGGVELNGQNDGLSPGMIFLITFGSLVVVAILGTIVYRTFRKAQEAETFSEKEPTETAKEIESGQTF